MPVSAIAVVEEGVDIGVGEDDDIATVSAISAVGATFWDVFFAAHGDAAIPSFSGLNFDNGFVDEHGVILGGLGCRWFGVGGGICCRVILGGLYGVLRIGDFPEAAIILCALFLGLAGFF